MLLPLLSLLFLSVETPVLQWRTFDEAAALAKRTNKPLYINFYADWCGFCKKMDRETFTDPVVVNMLQERFILVKIDVESEATLVYKGKELTSRQFARILRASSLPTSSFLDSNGNPITYLPGKPQTELFVHLLTFIANGDYSRLTFETYLKTKGNQ